MKYFRAPHFICFSSGILVPILVLLASAAMAEDIKIGGTGNALGNIRLLGAAFTKKYPDLKIPEAATIGSAENRPGIRQNIPDESLVDFQLIQW